jgi:hypothetical protein
MSLILIIIMKGYSVATRRRATTRRSLAYLPINRPDEVKCKAYLYFFSRNVTALGFLGVKSSALQNRPIRPIVQRQTDAPYTHQS